MKTLYAISAVAFIALVWSLVREEPEPDLDILEEIATESMNIVEEVAYLCNVEINNMPYVSCTMSIERWSMDLALPAGDASMLELELITSVFCRIGELIGVEPEITVNGLKRACGGLEV
jgi:hypothetical protein